MLRARAATTAATLARSDRSRPCPSPTQPTTAVSTGFTLRKRPKPRAGSAEIPAAAAEPAIGLVGALYRGDD